MRAITVAPGIADSAALEDVPEPAAAGALLVVVDFGVAA